VRKEVYGIFWSSSSGNEAVTYVIAWRFHSLYIHMTSMVIRTCPYVTTDSLKIINSHSYNSVSDNLKWHTLFVRRCYFETLFVRSICICPSPLEAVVISEFQSEILQILIHFMLCLH
jgi:hypothetical protein